MLLTRSKTSSAISNKRHKTKENQHEGFPMIPTDLISQIMLDMMTVWIFASRVADNQHSTSNAKPNQSTSIRSWATRSFLVRSKSSLPSLPPAPLPQPNESSLSEHRQEPTNKLPISLKSMTDLLETPPLIPDGSSLSLIEETLTPLSSAFFQPQEATRAPSLSSEENQSQSIVTTVASSRDIRSVRRSLSSIFNHFGSSVKNAFKKKTRSTSFAQLKKTFSVQQHLSTHPPEDASPFYAEMRKSCTSLILEADEEDSQVSSSYQISSYEDNNEIETPVQERSLNSLHHKKSESDLYTDFITLQEPSSMNSAFVSLEEKLNNASKPALYWDDDSTQSQQFNRLLDDIWETSQEYQDYFAAEQQLQQQQEQQQQQPKLWSPQMLLRSSRTESNMNQLQDAVPYVCVGKEINSLVTKAYKRSMSAYSNIQDYDLKWQASFHEEQKSRDKVAKTLKSVSWAFYSIIKHNHKLNEFYCDGIFDENDTSISDLSEYQHYTEPLTEWNDIYDQLAYVFDCGELTAEHAIITFIYVRRMLDISKQKLWDFSWRMIVMSSLLTAVKVWDDCAIFNADFAMIFPELSLDVM
ncbi:uncharacterized protein B0P05DRAFT_539399 [Gilbertella persicaria]|uniref:uncharacterized protein n=1 Tax=Gilbertella persicaria TaxID=101096 RepID=UPI002220FCE5|nr:uncharacterized protein B0P05DRAFT_539399 [Gilbertella persicaria]KAI8080741.1 hypothetical protein B0P05DRAFT_539399 [Gilbertella persicaria]